MTTQPNKVILLNMGEQVPAIDFEGYFYTDQHLGGGGMITNYNMSEIWHNYFNAQRSPENELSYNPFWDYCSFEISAFLQCAVAVYTGSVNELLESGNLEDAAQAFSYDPANGMVFTMFNLDWEVSSKVIVKPDAIDLPIDYEEIDPSVEVPVNDAD